jgi:hypothetical protein
MHSIAQPEVVDCPHRPISRSLPTVSHGGSPALRRTAEFRRATVTLVAALVIGTSLGALTHVLGASGSTAAQAILACECRNRMCLQNLQLRHP